MPENQASWFQQAPKSCSTLKTCMVSMAPWCMVFSMILPCSMVFSVEQQHGEWSAWFQYIRKEELEKSIENVQKDAKA